MTKAQLLADLLAKDFVDWVGTPQLLDTLEDGAKKYTVQTRQAVDVVAAYVMVNFFVVAEGQGGETAYYADQEPARRAAQQAFLKVLWGLVLPSPDSYKGLQVLWFDEVLKAVIYVTLSNANPATQQVWYYRQGGGGTNPVQITSFNPALIGTVARP